MKTKVICVIPAYNEEKRILKTIKKLRNQKTVNKIIVVNDGSTDKTYEISKKAGAKVISYEKNQGVGYATKIGLKKAISFKPNVIIILDADYQHEPKYIYQFIEKIKNGFDYVYGLRDFSNYPLDRKIGNWGLSFLVNLFYPAGIKDTQCGYRALSLEAAKKINLKGNRYEREMDFVREVWKNKFKVSYVNIIVPHFYPKFAVIRGFKEFFYMLKRRIKDFKLMVL
jgi:dolichol-phosphate mannosyltransferase